MGHKFARYHSLFFKQFAILVVAGIAVNCLAWWGFHNAYFREPLHELGERNLDRYLAFIAKEVESPPNVERIQALEGEIGLSLRIEDQKGLVIYGQALPSYAEAKSRAWKRSKLGHPIGKVEKHLFLLHETPVYRYAFYTTSLSGPAFDPRIVACVLCGFFAILLLTYLAIRHTLMPITALLEGIAEAKKGNLSYRIVLCCRGQFALIAEAFNGMLDRIEQLVKAKDQMLLDVSHELRSPLARLKLGLEFLEDGAQKASLAEDVAEMEQMIGYILDTAKLRSDPTIVKPTPMLLDTLLRDAEALAVSKGLAVHMTLSPDLPPIMADAFWSKRVLRNLVDNAAIHSGGSNLEIRAEVLEGKVMVSLMDDGDGVPENEQERVFEPFARLDPARSRGAGGYGLGLPLCRNIMEAQGGSVTLNRSHAGGTVVRLLFVAADSA